jgi:hypothetical protein
MSIPGQPDAGNLFLAVSTDDGAVHSTSLKASDGKWQPFDTAFSAPSPGRKAVRVGVTPYQKICAIDDLSRISYAFYDWYHSTWSTPLQFWYGVSQVGAEVAYGPVNMAMLGIGDPDKDGWAFSLLYFLAQSDGRSVIFEGDQAFSYDVGDLDPSRPAVSVDTAGTFGLAASLYDLCLVNATGGIYHLRVDPRGASPRFGDVKLQAGDPGFLTGVSCSQADRNLHVCAVDNAGTIHHTIRFADGSWQGFGDVNAATGSGDAFRQVAISAFNDDGTLHVAGVTRGGDLQHTVRHRDGTWDGFVSVKTTDAGNPGTVTSVDIGVWPALIG